MKQRKSVKKIVSRTGKWAVVFLLLSVLFMQQSVYAAAGNITGTVFRDYNADGVKQPLEPGIAGIIVTAYDANGTASPVATTAANGTYTIAHTFAGDDARVEFTLPSDGSLDFLQPGAAGNTTVQFVDISGGDVSGIDVGFNNPSQYSQPNPELFTPVYIVQDNLSGPNNTDPVSAAVAYSANSNTPAITRQVPANQMGATYGVAWQPESGSLFTSSYIKYASGLGPNGSGGTTTGGIYLVSGTGAAATASLFMDLETTLGLGADPHPASGATCTSAVPGTNPISACWYHDSGAFATVGKMGLGDLDFNGDQTVLYTVDLTNRQLVGIPVGNPAVAPAAAAIQTYNIPTNACANAADARPFALAPYDDNPDKMYVGVTCTGQTSGLASDMSVQVYEFDSGGAGTFTNIFSNTLNYPRLRSIGSWGACSTAGGNCRATWRPWVDSVAAMNIVNENPPDGKQIAAHPQPMLADIAFDGPDLVLAIRDRTADMFGSALGNPTNNADPLLYDSWAAGDLLRACDTGSGWTMESNGVCGGVPGSGQNNTDGYTNGEYYFDQSAGAEHSELFLGGLTQIPGFSSVAATMYDGTGAFNTGDISTWTNGTGAQLTGARLYLNIGPNFGKANGLGDLEALRAPAPIEIGNRIWNDSDNDGIQDPGEAGMENVIVNLYTDPDGIPNSGDETLVGTDTTDASGNYLFGGVPDLNMTGGNSVNRNTNYLIAVEGSQSAVNGLVLSPANAPQPANGNASDSSNDAITDIADSDAVDMPTGNGGSLTEDFQISMTTGGSGSNNHGLDIGFPPVALGSTIWIDANGNGVQDSGELGMNGATVTLLDSSGNPVTTDTNGNPITPFVTGADGTYYFNNLLPGDYIVQVTPLNTTYAVGTNQNGNTINGADSDNLDSNINTAASAPAGSYWSGVVTLAGGTQQTNEAQVCCGGSGAAGSDNPGGVNSANDANANMTVDMGFVPTVSLGSFVWGDTNGDGIQDSGEPGIPGATVTLLDGSGTPVTTDVNGNAINPINTGSNGFYSFSNLIPGDYIVQVTPPTGYNPSATQSTGAINGSTGTNVSNTDSNIDATNTSSAPAGSYRSGTITLTHASEPTGELLADGVTVDDPNGANGGSNAGAVDASGNMTVDFAFEPTLVALGSTVWIDANGDGVQQNGENGLAGATVYLVDSSGNQVTSDALGNDISAGITTGADGTYVFENLLPNDYYVEVSFPGYAPSNNQNGNAVDNTDAGNENVSNIDSNIDTGATAAVGDYRSGLITLTADNEPTGEAQVCCGGSGAVGSDNPNGVNSANDNDANMTIDFGVMPVVALGSTVWLDVDNDGVQDSSESGLAGAVVYLRNPDGSAATDVYGNAIGTYTTLSDGYYYFENLVPGNYFVEVSSPTGYVLSTTQNGSAVNSSAAVNKNVGNTDSNIDTGATAVAGDYRSGLITLTHNSEPTGETQAINGGAADDPPTTGSGVNSASDNNANMTVDFGFTGGSISDYVWNDQNGDGVQDPTESGIAGVTVWLDLNNDGVKDPLEPSDVTDANGQYYIGGLPAGTYTVRTDATTGSPINGATPTYDLDGTGTPNVAVVPLVAGQNRTDVDWGYQYAALSITKTSDATGTVSPGDTIEYTLVVRNNTASQHTGIVISDTLPIGTTYVAQSTVAQGYAVSGSLADYLHTFENGLTYSGSQGSINWTGNWIEYDNDGANNSPTAGNIQVVNDATNCPSGNNCLRVEPEDAGDAVFRLADLTVSACNAPAVISLEYDYNNQLAGNNDEVQVRLYAGAYRRSAGTYTNVNQGSGSVSFPLVANEISAATYVVVDIMNQNNNNYFFIDNVRFACSTQTITSTTLDNIPGGANSDLVNGVPPNLVGASDNFVLDAGQEMTVRFSVTVDDPVLGGLTSIDNTASVYSNQQLTPQEATHSDPLALANLGDRVWYDTNNDGLQDNNEVGVSGVVVNLYDPGPDGNVGGGDDVFIGTTTTDGTGNYAFNDLVVDTYFVEFVLPTGYTSFTTQNVGGDDALDSDADPTTGQTGLVTLVENTTNNTIDAGLANSQLDYGDLPNSYNNTILGNNGSRHVIGSLYLGAAVDPDPDGQESPTATGDTNDNGIELPPGTRWDGSTPVTIDVSVTGGPGVLGAWFDLNGNGNFNDPGEFVNGGTVSTGTQSVNFGSLDARNTTVNARFRLFAPGDIPGGSLDAGDYIGLADNGEVEDYQWSFGPTAVSLSSFNANSNVTGSVGVIILLSLMLVTGSFIIIWRRKVMD